MSILDALIASSGAGQIEIKYSISAGGSVKISSLDGYDRNSTAKRLVFYRSDKRIEEAVINSIAVKPGDKIEVRLE